MALGVGATSDRGRNSTKRSDAMRKRLWMAATILSALALLGSAAGAANRGAEVTTLDPEGVAATVSANVATTMANEHATVAETQAVEANDNDENETEADEDDD